MPRHEWVVVDDLSVEDLNDRDDLILLDIDYEVAEMNEELGWGYGCYFVKCGDGEYEEVYGMYGSIPYLDNAVYKLELREVNNG